MVTKLPYNLAIVALAGTASLALACVGAATAQADGATPATSGADVSFVVPVTHDPGSTGIRVYGEVHDRFLDDNLKDFSVSITCADGGPVAPIDFGATTRNGSSEWFESFSTTIDLSEQGKICTIHSTSPSLTRQLNFGNMPYSKPDDHNGARLYFVGNVIQRVTTRGGQY